MIRVGDVFLDQPCCHLDRIGDPFDAGAAMAFYDHTVQAQKDRAIMVDWDRDDGWSNSVAGRETRKPNLDRIELVKARFKRSVTKRAAPSIDFSAILPENPSHTTTSHSPRLILSASIKP